MASWSQADHLGAQRRGLRTRRVADHALLADVGAQTADAQRGAKRLHHAAARDHGLQRLQGVEQRGVEQGAGADVHARASCGAWQRMISMPNRPPALEE